MKNELYIVVLLLAACSQHAKPEAKAASPKAGVTGLPAAGQPGLPGAGQSKRALWIPIPKDKAELQRLLAMGYRIHQDHLHAPGVTSCPKMSENPVQ